MLQRHSPRSREVKCIRRGDRHAAGTLVVISVAVCTATKWLI